MQCKSLSKSDGEAMDLTSLVEEAVAQYCGSGFERAVSLCRGEGGERGVSGRSKSIL